MLRLRSIALRYAALAALAAAPLHAQLETRGGAGAPVRLTEQTVVATLIDGLANVAVRQVFRHGGAGDVEAVYTFPLPDDAALTGLALTTAGVRNEAVLAERRRAKRVYDEIVRGQRDPALLEEVGDGLFRLSVYPVAPNQDTVVELQYVQRAALLDGAQLLTLPLGGDAAWDATTTATVDVRVAAGLEAVVASLPGASVVRDGEQRALVSYERGPQQGEASPDGLTLTVQLVQRAPSFDVTTYRDERGEAWFVGVFSPGSPEPSALLPRDVVLVLDTSGSMRGTKLAEARAAARWLVDSLRDVDRVNIVRFSTDVEPVLSELALATPETRAQLAAAIDRFEAAGSTALGDALAHVATLPPAPGRARTVVLLTDGRPTFGIREPEALVALGRRIGEAGLRLHAFGVGQDVDDALLRGIALSGRGHAEVFTNPLEVATRLRRFLSRTSAPGLQDLRLAVRGVTASAVHPRVLPEAYFGEQVVVAGRLTGAGPAAFELSGTAADGPRTFRAVELVPAAAHGTRTTALNYALLRLADLDAATRLRAGLGDTAYRTAVEAWAAIDRGSYSTHDELVAESIRISLEHGVQCAYTSFLAVEEDDRRSLADAPAGSPFGDAQRQDVIGVGGGAGGRFAGRAATRHLRAASGAGSEQAVSAGLEWLKVNLPAEAGQWTLRAEALALLAHMGDGHTSRGGHHREVAASLERRLLLRFDAASGTFGDPSHPGAPYADAELDQLLATLALSEAYYLGRSPLLRRTALAAFARAAALLLDEPRRAALSPEALRVAVELCATAREAGLTSEDLTPAAAEEARRRLAAGADDWLLDLVVLAATSDPAARADAATALAPRAIAGTAPNLGERAALRLWLASDTLRAAAGPGWTAFDGHRTEAALKSQVGAPGAAESGAWRVGDGHERPASVAAITATHVLVLECTSRLHP